MLSRRYGRAPMFLYSRPYHVKAVTWATFLKLNDLKLFRLYGDRAEKRCQCKFLYVHLLLFEFGCLLRFRNSASVSERLWRLRNALWHFIIQTCLAAGKEVLCAGICFTFPQSCLALHASARQGWNRASTFFWSCSDSKMLTVIPYGPFVAHFQGARFLLEGRIFIGH